MYDAIVFDNDGVLTELTDRDVLREAIQDAFDAAGVPDPPRPTSRPSMALPPPTFAGSVRTTGSTRNRSGVAARKRRRADRGR
jgi:beta-phosphoglucomutase-like phosphatase (HAD superfamily)